MSLEKPEKKTPGSRREKREQRRLSKREEDELLSKDERVVADMSEVTRPSLFGVNNWRYLYQQRHGSTRSAEKIREDAARAQAEFENAHPEEKDEKEEDGLSDVLPVRGPMSPEERRSYIGMALRAALLVALVFIGGIGLVILLMVLFW